jgi:hypothetical protein
LLAAHFAQTASSALNPDPLHLVQADVVLPPIVELGRARAGVVGHGRGILQRAAVLQVGGDAGGPEGVIADPGAKARRPLFTRLYTKSR